LISWEGDLRTRFQEFRVLLTDISLYLLQGMVAASVRHLHSLRLLRRDKGWINTMLEDAANERMHLLIALKMFKPGVFMRTMLLLSQGVFYNFFFLFYLVAPRVAHRFVGILEEEAVVTYSRICDDIVEGRLPEWEHYPAPQIAIDYWGLKEDAKILDVMRSLRADEANHRYVFIVSNHNLQSKGRSLSSISQIYQSYSCWP